MKKGKLQTRQLSILKENGRILFKHIILMSGNEGGNFWSINIILNRETGEILTSSFLWLRNKEEHKRIEISSYLKNKEKRNASSKEYYKQNKKEVTNRCKRYYLEHKEKYLEKDAKRKRNLGFIPINSHFLGAEAHHLTKELVIYIPRELHRSVYHNIFSGKGMDEINDKILIWLGKNDSKMEQ